MVACMVTQQTELTELLGFDVEAARTAAGMTKQDLCRVARVSLRQYHQWLRGVSLPSGRSVLRLRGWYSEHDFGEQDV